MHTTVTQRQFLFIFPFLQTNVWHWYINCEMAICCSSAFLQIVCIKLPHTTTSTNLKPVERWLANTGCNSCHLVQRARRTYVRHERSHTQFRRGGSRRINAVESQDSLDWLYVTVVNERLEPLLYVVHILHLIPLVQRPRHQLDVTCLVGTACRLSNYHTRLSLCLI